MTLTLNIPVEIEKYLTQKAQEKSISMEACALQLLLQRISTQEESSKLIDLVQSWMDDDGEVTMATTNVGYLSRFVPAQLWCDITP